MKSWRMSKYNIAMEYGAEICLAGQSGLVNRVDKLCVLASLHLHVISTFRKPVVPLLRKSFKIYTTQMHIP